MIIPRSRRALDAPRPVVHALAQDRPRRRRLPLARAGYFSASEREACVFDPLNFGKLTACILLNRHADSGLVELPLARTADTCPDPLMMKSKSTVCTPGL